MIGHYHQLVCCERRTATVCLAVTIAILLWASPELLLAQTGRGNVATPNGLQHVLTIEHALGSLVPRGFLPLRVTIARQGPAAACQRDTSYWVVSSSREYGMGGFRRLTDAAEMVLGRGGTTLTGDVVLRPGSGWNTTLFVESDGNLEYFSGKGDHGVFHDSLVTNLGANSTNVQCLFVGKDQLDDVTTCSLTENTRQRFRNQMQGPGDLVSPAPAVTGNPIPSVWYLNEILGQANLQTYQRWTGMPTTTAVPSRPSKIDAAAHLDTIQTQQFIGWTSPDRLPAEWHGLMAADFVFISQPTLKTMVSGQPKAWQALRDWVAAGGRLVISECGDDFAGLREVDSDLFQLSAGEQRNSWRTLAWSAVVDAIDQRKFELGLPPEEPALFDENGIQDPNRNRVLPMLSLATGPDDAGLTNQGHTVIAQRDLLSNLALATGRFDPGNSPGEGETVFADFGAGRIIAMPGSNADWQMGDWKRVIVTAICGAPGPLMIDSFQTSAQFGFPEAQMPEIGKPPWLPFMALIILFVIGVGPVAYTILERRKRVPWMLAIVPGVATVCTLGLLVYALASEGLGSRSVRLSYTRLDQKNRVALTRTQLIGYSGVAPGGYRFSRDEILFPDETPRYDLTTVADAEGRSVRGGAIRPRTVHQLQVARVAGSDQALRVVRPADGAAEWEVTNRLGTDCGPVIVHTADGYVYTEHLSSGATVRLKPADRQVFDRWVAGQYAQRESQLSKAQWLQLRLFNPNANQAWQNFRSFRETTEPVADEEFQRHLHLILAAFGADESHEQAIGEGYFFALATDNPDAARFPHRSRDMGELHLIYGRW